MSRQPLIAGNWKMHTSVEEGKHLLAAILQDLEGHRAFSTEALVCPPLTHIVPLAAALELVDSVEVKLGAQNCWITEQGAHTGEVSPEMLRPYCQYVIVGHSERRADQAESDELVGEKLKQVQQHGMVPILCVGEASAMREAGDHLRFVAQQLEVALCEVNPDRPIVVAYEPIWAIGSGAAATPEQAQEIIGMIRAHLRERLGERDGENTRILYGGSTTPDNLAGFMSQPDIDGALVGGASLKAETFAEMVRMAG